LRANWRDRLVVRVVEWRPQRYQPGAPSYVPGLWNRQDRIGRANCLAYALDDMGQRWPGSDSGSTASLDHQLRGLGLRRATIRSLLDLPARRHLMAVFVSSPASAGIDYMDFHCYRLDCEGRWSHKPGPLAVTRRDIGGAPIAELWHAEHPLFITDFLGLYWVP
jgi:hypothetical protein